jgi:hypothetical protein
MMTSKASVSSPEPAESPLAKARKSRIPIELSANYRGIIPFLTKRPTIMLSVDESLAPEAIVMVH